MAFMGGHPPKAYQERGFEVFSSVVDIELRDLVKDRQLVPANADHDSAARMSYCVKFFLTLSVLIPHTLQSEAGIKP